MKVSEIMSTPPVVCPASRSVADAAVEMWRHDVGALPVVNDENVAVGMITDRDICIAVATRGKPAAEIPVDSVITHHLSYVHPDDDLASAIETIARDQVHRLPVLDDEAHVVGVVSLNDLVLRADSAATDPALSSAEVLGALKSVSTHWPSMSFEHVEPTTVADGNGHEPHARRRSRRQRH